MIVPDKNFSTKSSFTLFKTYLKKVLGSNGVQNPKVKSSIKFYLKNV